MHETNDNLMLLLAQPPLFLALYAGIYIVSRFVISRNGNYLIKRFLFTLAVSALIYGIAASFVPPLYWFDLVGPWLFLGYVFVVFFANIMLWIWYKR